MNNNDIIKLLQIPSYSGLEYRMIKYIIRWCEKHNIRYSKDKYNNLYLTKGKCKNGQYYPCITVHLDTVHKDNIQLIKNHKNIPIIIEKYNKITKIYSNKGIGGDNKCGIIIALSLLKQSKLLKVALFVSEEKNLYGSNNLFKPFFRDIGYVISFDSPGRNNGAYACNGLKLFSYNFYFKEIKNICDRYKCHYFNNEPNTDIVNIKRITNVECMIFGGGFYNPHSKNEYIILEDVKHAIKLGYSLIKNLKNKKYTFFNEEYVEYKHLNEMMTLYKNIVKNRNKKIIDIINNTCKKLQIDSYDNFKEVYKIIDYD